MPSDAKSNLEVLQLIVVNCLWVGLLILVVIIIIKYARKKPEETRVLGLYGDNMPRNFVVSNNENYPQSVTITFVPSGLVAGDTTAPASPQGRTLGTRSPQLAEAA
jgi:hypothetical protein